MSVLAVVVCVSSCDAMLAEAVAAPSDALMPVLCARTFLFLENMLVLVVYMHARVMSCLLKVCCSFFRCFDAYCVT